MVRSPTPRHLTLTIAAAGGDPDSRRHGRRFDRTDISTAKAAGIPVIAVPFGYTDVPVEDLDPDVIIVHYAELGQAVRRIGAAWGLDA